MFSICLPDLIHLNTFILIINIETDTEVVMRKLVTASAVLLLVAIAANAIQSDQQYGAPLTISEVTSLTDIMAAPEKFIGKEVRTAGYIFEMCTGSGCWIGLLPSIDSEHAVKISFMATDVRFPISEETTGHYVELQGTIISAEAEAEAHAEHMEAEGTEHAHEQAEAAPSETRTIYYCPMHEDVVQEGEGRCPLCRMNLVSKEIPVPHYEMIAIEGTGAIIKEKK